MCLSFKRWVSFFCYLLIVAIAGCGDAFIAELRSGDGQLRITIKDPAECDQSRTIYAIVKGLSASQPPQRIGLRDAVCSYRIDADVFALLEGPNWCAVMNADVTTENSTHPLDSVSLIIDRGARQLYYVDGSEFSGCPIAIRESVATEVKTFRRKGL